MMPWESWNARDAAWLRIERASARTIEEEMAARWWGKKDGEARRVVVRATDGGGFQHPRKGK